MLMTPTDFWLICPNGQLRLPDNSLCAGPDRNSVNCMKHAVSSSQHGIIKHVFNAIPDAIVSSMIFGINHGFFSNSWFSPYVQALSKRSGFLRERMNKLDKMIIPTRLMETMLVNHGLLPEKVVFSRFGIQPTPRVARTQDQRGMLRVGFIGGLSEHKGAHLLISAVRLIAESLPLVLKIYGNKDAFPHYVERLIKLSEGDQRIQLCSTFPNEQIGNIFSELDVLVVPSIWYENTPLVIYSAQAAGCPVIASNLGGMSEVVEHEKNGLLFKAGDVAALSNAIERVAIDRTLLKQLADNAIKPKTISEYVTELQGIYEEVLLERRGNK
jgi:glycosyltransferase involved in cell wall biosynthesis